MDDSMCNTKNGPGYYETRLRCRICGCTFSSFDAGFVPQYEEQWNGEDFVWSCIRWPDCCGRDTDLEEIGRIWHKS
jgi:hypothetical protein